MPRRLSLRDALPAMVPEFGHGFSGLRETGDASLYGPLQNRTWTWAWWDWDLGPRMHSKTSCRPLAFKCHFLMSFFSHAWMLSKNLKHTFNFRKPEALQGRFRRWARCWSHTCAIQVWCQSVGPRQDQLLQAEPFGQCGCFEPPPGNVWSCLLRRDGAGDPKQDCEPYLGGFLGLTVLSFV